jgi:uncharacterized protein (TIGR02186 family)
MKRIALALALLAGVAVCARAQTIVVVLSAEVVAITSNFTGADVTVFGALEFDRPAEDIELVVVLRGPPQSLTTRRKERLLGMWINRGSETFAGAPAFYALRATAPLDTIAGNADRDELGLGLDTVVPTSQVTSVERRAFAAALVRLQVGEGRYSEAFGVVDRPSDTIFRTTFTLPADVPVGRYVVEVLMFDRGEVVASAVETLEIIKTGAEQFIYEASRKQPWLYALAVVAIAAASGWLGGVVFRRD